MPILFIYAAFKLLLSSVEALTCDQSFMLHSSVASLVVDLGQKMLQWLKEARNESQAREFASTIVCRLQDCIPPSDKFKSVQSRRERMWSNYHQLRCSSEYTSAWNSFLIQCLGTPGHPILLQNVGDRLFKCLIKSSFPISQATAAEKPSAIRS